MQGEEAKSMAVRLAVARGEREPELSQWVRHFRFLVDEQNLQQDDGKSCTSY